MKKGSKLYEYLESTGVLVRGNKEDILNAKKQYWLSVRKEWQNQKRRECNSYTVFFTPSEYEHLVKALKDQEVSITAFIKQSALHAAGNGAEVHKVTTGKVRAAFFEAYNLIEELSKKGQTQVLQHFIDLEQKVLKLLSPYK